MKVCDVDVLLGIPWYSSGSTLCIVIALYLAPQFLVYAFVLVSWALYVCSGILKLSLRVI